MNPSLRRSDKKTNLKHRSYRPRAGERQSRQGRQGRRRGEKPEDTARVRVEECGDSQEDPTTGHHYQEAGQGESHYQTPKMSRCQPG